MPFLAAAAALLIGSIALLILGANPITASILFGAMLLGANRMQRAVQVPSALIPALNGLIVVFVLRGEFLHRRIARKQEVQRQLDSPASAKKQLREP